jgi:Tol biopolymer transport system component
MWSPDDTQIAYMVALDGGGLLNELRVVDVRTGVDRLVVTAREDGSVNRGWSPAGDRLLFRAYWLDPDIDIHRDKTALWSVRLDGTDPRLMVEDVGGFDVRP